MNPGLLRECLRLERQGETTDEMGQPLKVWAELCSFRGRRMRTKSQPEETAGDRDTEVQKVAFQVRSNPFAVNYQDGDRLYDLTGLQPGAWSITGWSEVEGSNGELAMIECERTGRMNDSEG